MRLTDFGIKFFFYLAFVVMIFLEIYTIILLSYE